MNEILAQLKNEKSYIEYANKIILDEFEKIKQEAIEEFENHPVTIEIEQGVSSDNISNTLEGITNLYSFIGFESGDRPTEIIKELLKASNVKKTINKNSTINYSFDIPTAAQIFKATPLPWSTGRSWARGIEEGISGLGYYLKQVKNSRSGLGVQSQKQIRSGVKFRNTKYISDLINRYNKKIKNLEKLNL